METEFIRTELKNFNIADVVIALKIKREAEEKLEAELLAKEEAKRRESLKPDKERLIALAGIINVLELPDISSPEGKIILEKVRVSLGKLSAYLINEAGKL